MRKAFDRFFDTTAGRFILSIICLVSGAAIFVLFVGFDHPFAAFRLLLASIFLIGVGVFGVLVTLYRTLFPGPQTKSNRLEERRAQSIIKKGRALPLPPAPKQLPAISKSMVLQARGYTLQMQQLASRWRKQGIPVSATRPANFEEELAKVHSVTGNWNDLAGPLRAFGEMPAPWRWIGAAEIIRYLAYWHNRIFVTSTIRQGLRFIVEAQDVDPQNVDALLTRVTLLTCSDDPQWIRMALETLTMARQLAPTHPRLPKVEIDYYTRIGDHDQALAANERLIALAPSAEEANRRRAKRADMLMEANRLEEAAAVFAEVAPTFPDNPWLWHNYSIVLRRLKRYHEALEVSDHALSVMEFKTARDNNNWLRTQLGKPANTYQV